MYSYPPHEFEVEAEGSRFNNKRRPRLVFLDRHYSDGCLGTQALSLLYDSATRS